ncbi:MAG: TerC family protein [Alphaproteobacteria bacterium]|nr:TerC family protein [Alphaproteobacteria bacterium]
MVALLFDPEAWLSLLTLTALEVVLGIDNIIFLSVVSSRLPLHQQRAARRIGLVLALGGRLGLLVSISWILALTEPLFALFGHIVSWRDLVLLVGGLFLMAKGTIEMHFMLEGGGGKGSAGTATFGAVLGQIVLLDIVFSLDSIITAVGMVDHIEIMVVAIFIAVGVMLVAAEPVSGFVNRHPTVKMLALSFLLLIGMALVADGLQVHVPRGYLYAAIAFSCGVEALNLLVARRRTNREKVSSR